jgi:pyruvate,orthophosphate dikinase
VCAPTQLDFGTDSLVHDDNTRIRDPSKDLVRPPAYVGKFESGWDLTADFFSFGTNDLTQMTFGYSRDDIGSFLPAYLETGMLEKDPFQSIDTIGVGGLVKMACEKGRAVAKAEKKAFKLGVCGEHGGDPSSIAFFQKCGLDYVSCSPFRVPVARLAAAQAALA